jgi:Fe-S-cluster-containing hydrogenase component 2
VTDLYYPLSALRQGNWFKLICGASFQHLPAVRNLVLAYTLAGADCVDVAADPAVILAAKAALDQASEIASSKPAFFDRQRPWLMVSLNDGEDPHFRKAEFWTADCPVDCPRPCEAVCPAGAIAPLSTQQPQSRMAGVLDDRCYGCGRCIPICPAQKIIARSYVSSPSAIVPLVLQAGVDAVEIHTQVGRLEDFRRLWKAIVPSINSLKLVAISCPDGENLIDYLWALYDMISPLPCALIWQADGRPMSGDIGVGATKAAVKLGQKVLAAGLPGYVQLAGGTNHHTAAKLASLGLLRSAQSSTLNSPVPVQNRYIAGVGYGSYARSLLLPILNQLEADSPTSSQLEDHPALLWQAVNLARSLVDPLKSLDRALSVSAST